MLDSSFIRRSLCVMALVIACSSASPAAVLTVGQGCMFEQIQEAVDAVTGTKGVILIRNGTYDSFTVIAKDLVIMADQGADVQVMGGITVHALDAKQRIFLLGMKVVAPEGDGLVLVNNEGHVRVQDCEFPGESGKTAVHPQGSSGTRVQSCNDVAFMRSTLIGGAGADNTGVDFFAGKGGVGIDATASIITFYDCHVQGGPGGDEAHHHNAGQGGSGYQSFNAYLFSSGSDFSGGAGGRNLCATGLQGGEGGKGMEITWSPLKTRLLDCTCTGGKGGDCPAGVPGPDGSPMSGDLGNLVEMDGKARFFKMPAPIREQDAITLTFKGEPDEFVFLLHANNVDSLFVPELNGQWLLAIAELHAIYPIGKIPPGGTLDLSFTVPEVGCGFT